MRMRGFLLEHVAWTVAAPASYLNELLSADRAFVDQLASEGPTLCARYGMTGLNGSETISDETRRLLTVVAVKKVAATRAGRDDPQAYGEITTPDAEALVAGMTQAGASDAIIDLMLGDASLGTQDQQCAGTRAIYRSMDAMPDDQAARVYATIIRGAAAEQRAQTP